MIYAYFDALGRIMHVVIARLEADDDPKLVEADRLLEHLRRWGAVRYEATGATWDSRDTIAEVVAIYDVAAEQKTRPGGT